MLLLLLMPQLLRPQQQQQQDPREVADSDTPCFVECVSQVKTNEEMQSALTEAGPDALVVVDFYKTACGACKYIQPG
jgi:thiol-disulfide isomerase/thioredoxin